MHTPDYESQCDKVVAVVDSGGMDVQVLELESFLDGYNGLKAIPSGKKCDLLMYSEEKIVLCEMTCSNPKYIGEFYTRSGEHKIGKRLTVRSQMANAINVLCAVPEVAKEVDERNNRVALFAYREKIAEGLSGFDSKVVANMNVLGEMQRLNANEELLSDLEHCFVFTEVKYPSVYKW